MTNLDYAQLSTVYGGQAAPGPAVPPALDGNATNLENAIITGANALGCSALDNHVAVLGNTPLGQAVQASADACWNSLRSSLITPPPQ